MQKRVKMVCPHCGSDNIAKDAAARWYVESQQWEVTNVFDSGNCDNCGEEIKYHDAVPTEIGMTADELETKYSPNGGGEHPKFTRSEWRRQVADDETISGYWQWVAQQVSEADYDDGDDE